MNTILKYERLIWNIAHQYWKMFPASARACYGIDDLVGDLTFAALRALPKFDPARGVNEMTFLYTVLANTAKLRLQYFGMQRRSVEFVDMELLHYIPHGDEKIRRQFEAVDAIERLLEDASDELRETFSNWIWCGIRTINTRCAAEMRALARRHSVSMEQLRLVLQMI